MQTTASDQLLSQTNANEQPKSHSLVNRDQYRDTPIMIITKTIGETDQFHSFAALGNKRITQYFDTPEEVITYVDSRPWELLITLMTAIADDTYTYKSYQQANK